MPKKILLATVSLISEPEQYILGSLTRGFLLYQGSLCQLQIKSMEVQWEAVKLITYLKRYNCELVKTPKRKINETFQQTLKFSETRSIVRQCIQFNLFKVFSTTQIRCVEINPKTAASTSNYHYSSISDIFKQRRNTLCSGKSCENPAIYFTNCHIHKPWTFH